MTRHALRVRTKTIKDTIVRNDGEVAWERVTKSITITPVDRKENLDMLQLHTKIIQALTD